MREVLAAVSSRIRSDVDLFQKKLGSRGPFYMRLPSDSPHTREVGAITMEFESVVEEGGKENQFVTLHVWGFRKGLVEDISKDIDRLFHSYRWRWVPLDVGSGAKAFTRVEFRADVLDSDSELFHKVIRVRVKYGAGGAG